MEIVVGVAAKVAEYMVGPIVRPIARRCPFKNLWEYKSNLENLKTELKNLEAKRESVQGLTNVGVEPLPDVKAWQDKVTNIIREVSGLTSEDNHPQQSIKCCKGCTYSNLKERCQHRNNIARKLKDVAQLLQEAMKSTNLWEYKSNLENLKKQVEKLEARRESVQRLVKDGEEPLQHVKLWQENVYKIIAEVSRLINPQQQNMQCCSGLICSDLDICYQRSNNVARMLRGVALLLQEARDFREVSTISEETVYKSNLQKLKKKVETLNFKRESVQRLIKVGEEPLPDVKVWQDRVKKIIDEVRGLTIEHNPEHQNKVAHMLKEIAQLLQEAVQFREVSCPSIPEQTCLQPSTQREFSKSRISILKDITAALTNADVNMVGIYGMGGVGKTTLAKKVGSQAMQDKLFSKIVFVEVSQSPDIRTIQGVIADYLGLKFQEETVPGRAIKLCDVLKKEKKILLILDNLWKGIELEEVGIPFGNDCKGLKLLLIARSRDVLTKGMDSQHNFHVEALSEADAWILFKIIAGTCIDHHHLKSVAQEVAKKCGGMPVAIVTIAKALKDTQSEDEWKEALRRLNNPSSENFEGITKEVYNSIKLSYECLDGKLKEIFLLCSLMGCTYYASIQDLFRYGLGLGFFDEFDTVEDALCNVYASVNQLKAASLLLDAHAPSEFFRPVVHERFAMHDVICAVARSIASEDRHVLFVPQSLTNENKLKNCTSISLYNIGELLKDLKLVCPQLKFLYVKPMLLYPKTHSRISGKFFAWMPRLQVLHLIQMDLCSTPLSDLVNLRTLSLEYCVLKDIADIGDLKNLEILSFLNCTGFKLPEKFPQLTKLKLLELNCYELKSIPSEFILSFKKLEALYLSYTSIKWEVEKSNNGSRNASCDVLEHLSNLTSLEICVPDATISRGLLAPTLERYNITIGGFLLQDMRLSWNIRCKTYRFLQVKLITNEDGIISGLKPIRQLVLDEVPGIANNICGLDRIGFPELEDLKVQNNSHIVHIVDVVSSDGAFPVLKSLILWNLINLKTICNGSLGMKLFHQLRTIKVGKCYELTNLFSLASDRVFQELEEIEVEHCEKMKEIFAISEQVHEIKFSKLCILRLTSLPQLESLCCNVKTTSPMLEFTGDIKPEEIILEEERDVSKPLFNENVVVTNLETLEINNINVKWISDNQLPTMVSIPNLTCLIISNLANLRRLGSGDYIKFPSLKEMTIDSCPKFKELFFNDKVGVPSLETINIFKMDNLKMIWHNQLAEDSFPKLKSLQVQKCEKLLTLFRSNMCASFLSLETLYVRECGSLEEIFDIRGINSKECHPTTSTQSGELCTYSPLVVSFANLQNLNVSKCQRLKTLFSTSIVAKEEVAAKQVPATARFVFAKLTSLKLYKLLELRTFYPGRYTTEWPVLKALEINQIGINYPDCMTLQQQQLQLLLQQQQKQQQPQKQVVFEFQVGKFWPNLLWTMSSWIQNLTKLIVHGCGNLEQLFPYSMIVTEDIREKKMGNTIVFPKLNYLEMKQLANLKGLCSGCHIEFPTLTEFKISNCPQLTAFIFDDKIGVLNLKKINISSMDNLEVIWNCGSLEEIFDLHEINSQERHSTSTQSKELHATVLSFANLQNLKVSECRNLKSLFSISNDAEERVATKEAHATAKFVFPKLTSLELYKLPELITFYPARYTVEWPNLKLLKMDQFGIDGNNMWRLIQPLPLLPIPNQVAFEFQVGKIWPNLLWTMSSWVQSLTKLIVHGCRNLEELFPYSMIDTEEFREKKTGNTIVFPKLNYLEMEQLANLKGLSTGYHIEFPTLSRFKISNCSKLTAFIFNDKVKVPSLKRLKISSMDNLKMIWDNQLTKNSIPKLKSMQVQGCLKMLTLLQWNMCCESFSRLKTLDVSDCDSLEEIFDLHEIKPEKRHSTRSTPSQELNITALNFPCLKKLKVSECRSLKSLFSVWNVAAKEAHATAKFLFPKLTSFELSKLPQLKTFYPARYEVVWRSLSCLQLCDCGISDTDNEDQMQHLLFMVEKAVPCLKKLILSGSELMMMWQGQDPEPLFGNFKILKVLDESKADYLLYESQPVLHYIGDVKYMWIQNFKLDLILPNFEKIVVGRCDIFISLMPPSASLRNLTSLEVNDCNSLEHIGTFSMAKNLVRLVSLGIYRCKKIVEVLRNHEDVTGDEILFSNLKRLSLKDLPSLASFCSWNFTLEFPSLEELNVYGCPNMKIFSQGELTTPKLHKVKSGWRSIKLCPDVDVNTAIQQFHEQKQVAESFIEDWSDFSIDESE